MCSRPDNHRKSRVDAKARDIDLSQQQNETTVEQRFNPPEPIAEVFITDGLLVRNGCSAADYLREKLAIRDLPSRWIIQPRCCRGW